LRPLKKNGEEILNSSNTIISRNKIPEKIKLLKEKVNETKL